MGFNKKQHDFWSPLIDKKQYIEGFGGRYCNWCGALPVTLQKKGLDPNLIEDHIDNIEGHNVIENLQWLCRGCNKRKNPRHAVIPMRVMTQSEYTNKQEKPYRDWIMQKVIDNGGFTIKQAIFSGAEIFHVSPDTIDRRWLPKLVSDAGPLDHDQLNDMNEPILTLKSHEAKTETEKKREAQEKLDQEQENKNFVRGAHFFKDK